MGIWIRSQNRKILGQYNRFYVSPNYKMIGCDNSNSNDNIYDELGLYSTSEKLTKVLDMIQDFIKNTYISVPCGNGISQKVIQNSNCKIFEMPQDYEVSLYD